MEGNSVLVDITSSTIEVSSTVRVEKLVYALNRIDLIKIVEVKESYLSLAVNGRRKYAIMIRFDRSYIALLVSRDIDKMDEVLYRIRQAISARERGNSNYVTSVTLNGNVINQSGNFEVGYNSGVVDL